MKTRMTLMVCGVWLALGLVARAQNNCMEGGPYTNNLSCTQEGTLSAGYALSPTNITVTVGQPIPQPSAYGLSITNGQESYYVSYDCSPQLDGTVYSGVNYTFGLTFNPSFPQVLENPGVYYYTGMVTAVGSPCGPLFTNIGIVTVNVVTNTLPCTPAPAGIVAWWPGEGNLDDIIGTNNGVVTNGTVGYAPAEVGLGFDFNGGPNRLIVPDSPSLNFGPNVDFTIECWLRAYPTNLPQGVMSIADKRYAPNSYQCQGYEISIYNGQLNLRISDNSSGNGGSWSAGPNLLDGHLHHVAVTVQRDSTTGGNMYVDGTNILQFDPTPVEGDLTTTQPLRIGNHPTASYTSFFDGQIDELSLYKRALTPGEIAGIYLAGAEGKCPPAPPSCDPPPSGIISWWPGEGNGDDIIGTNNGILDSGVTFTNGVVGQAFHFNGSNQDVRIPYSTALEPTNITVECWVNLDSLTSSVAAYPGLQYIVFKQNSRSGQFEGYDLEKNRINGQDVFRFQVTSASGQQVPATATTIPQPGVWYHLAGTYDGTTVKIYVDGVLEGTNIAGFPLNYGTEPVYFGTTGQSYDGRLEGALDEVSIYNRALSSNEIAAIFDAGSAGKCKSMPWIVVQPPINQTVNEGGNATFSVIAAGSAPLSYQWQYNGNDITYATGASSYSRNDVQPSDAGNYRVIVSNAFGSVTSLVAQLTILIPPTITTQPANAAITYGGNAAFTVAATGASSYQWRCNGTNIAGATGSSYTLNKPPVAASGNAYSVVVYGPDFGYVISQPALLTVNRAILTVTANNQTRQYGLANPTLTWSYSGFVAGENQSVLSGSPTVSTTATPSSPVAGSPYPIVISDGGGGGDGDDYEPSLTAANYAFNFVNGQLTVTEGNLTIEANNASKPTGAANPVLTGTITPPLVAADNITVVYTTPATTSSPEGTYAIIPVISDPNDKLPNYNLTVDNGTLTVSDGPFITSQPASLERAPLSTSTATFTVQANGAPTLNYQWIKDGVVLTDNGTNIAGSGTSILTLTGITASNGGDYWVKIWNSAGSVTSAVAVLSVLDVAIVAGPQDHYTAPGGSVTFNVNAQSTCNPPGCQWNKDGSALSDGTNSQIAGEIVGSTTPNLSLTNVQVAASGLYAAAMKCNQTTNTGGGGTLQVCDLYPIGMNTNTVLSHKDGDSITVQFSNNAITNYLFGWLTWSGDPSDTTLKDSFVSPDSSTYVNPVDGKVEPPIDSGKLVITESGTKTDVLSYLQSNFLNKEITIVVWDQYNPTYGAVRVYSFAQITITNMVVNGNSSSTLTYTLDGIGRCNDQCYVPTITLPPGTVTYTEGQPPEAIDASAGIEDAGNPNYNNWMLTAAFSANGLPEDSLSIQNQGTGSEQIGVSTSGGVTSVLYGGVPIGTVVGDYGSDDLSIALNSSANRESVGALLQNLMYQDKSCNPSTLTRTLSILMNENGSNDCASVPVTQTIQVTPINDPPTLANLPNISIGACSGPVHVDLTGIAAGCDKSQTLTVTASSSNPSLIPNPVVTYTSPNATGTLTLTPTDLGTGPVTITVTVQENGDGATGGTSSTSTQFVVNVTNCPPTIAFESTLTFTEHDSPLIIDPKFEVIDPDVQNFANGTLTFSFKANGLPEDTLGIATAGAISVSGQNVAYNGTQIGTFTGGSLGTPLVISFNANATLAAVQALAQSITYYDGSERPSILTRTLQAVLNDGSSAGNSAPTTTSIYVLPVNDPPVANSGSYSVASGGTLAEPASGGVLAKDTDPDGDSLMASLATAPQYGSVTVNSDGSFTYVSNPGTTASQDTFTYTVTDNGTEGQLENVGGVETVVLVSDPKSATATVTITITAPSCTVPTIATLTLDGSISDTVTGGSSAAGVVTLSAPTTLAGGQVINIASDNSSAIAPISVLVPQGAQQASFTIQTLAVASAATANITASYPSQTPLTVPLSITPAASVGNGGLPTDEPSGYTYSVFADDFPSADYGPIGMVKNSFGQILVTLPEFGELVILSDTDGQQYNSTVDTTVNVPAIYGLARLGGQIYGADLWDDALVELSDNGTVINSVNLSFSPLGLAANPVNGCLYATDANGSYVYEINPANGVVRIVGADYSAYFDGIAVSPDGQSVYAADQYNNAIVGFDIKSGAIIANIPVNPPQGGFVDGIALGQGTLAGKLFVNCTGGDLMEIDLNSGNVSTFSGEQGSRGDFIMVDDNGSMLITQSSEILRLTPPSGSSFGSVNGVICTRNDKTTTYSPIILGTVFEAVSKETNIFDVRGISGEVTSAYFSRSGSVNYSSDYGFEIEYGVAPVDPESENAKDNAYPPQISLPGANPGSVNYSTAFNLPLPPAYLQDLQSSLGGNYMTKLADRISSICDAASLTDTPQSQLPQGRNTLTFLASSTAAPQIPVGSSLDIALFGSDAPEDGQWDILFNGQIVASSGNPNGWEVELDQTPYHGAIVSVPLEATIGQGYEVRIAGTQAESTAFEVVPAGSIVRAATLLPLALSANTVQPGNSVTVTISLDQPAPAGGAAIGLTSDNSSASVPSSVTISAGTTTQTITVSIAANASAGVAHIGASYNGIRQATLSIYTGTGSPPGTPTVTAAASVGTVTLNWTTVSGALTYNVQRSLVSGGPYTTLFTGLTSDSYVDTAVVNGQTYYYVVSAQNDYGKSANSAEVSATPTFGQVATPVIPNVSGSGPVTVSLSDATIGAIIHYTLDGSEPTEGSPVYKDSFQLTTTTTIKAIAYKTGYLPSSTAVQLETVTFSAPSTYNNVNFSCGYYSVDTLSTSSGSSIKQGQAYFANDYALPSLSVNESISITLNSDQIDGVMYLFDDTGAPLATNVDSGSGEILTYTVKGTPASAYYLEVTTAFPAEIGDYTLFWDCGQNPPQIGVTGSGGVTINNNQTIALGNVAAGVPVLYNLNIQNVLTVIGDQSGLYAGPLQTVGNITALPQTVPVLPPNNSAAVTVNLDTSTTGTKSGTLTIPSNDPNNNPFVINFSATVLDPSQYPAPTISITVPSTSDGSSIAITPSATANEFPIANVQYFATLQGGSQVQIGEATPPPNTVSWQTPMNWLNVAPGTYTVTATVTDTAGRQASSASQTVTVTGPTVTGVPAITPASGTYQGSVTVTISQNTSSSATLIYSTDGGNQWFLYQQPVTLTYGDFNGPVTFEACGTENNVQSSIATATYTIAPPAQSYPPTASISSPNDGAQINSPVSVTGTTALNSSDPGAFGFWRLDYHVHGDATSPWVTIATGTSAVSDSTLGQFDPTLLVNGLYDIRLTVVNAAGDTTATEITVDVAGQQKVGDFTLAFVDMTVPVAGIQIQVTRTYDSFDKSQGDFGIGWRLGLSDVNVQVSNPLDEGWTAVQASLGYFQGYELEPSESHLISITFPGNKQYVFQEVYSPNTTVLEPFDYQPGTVTFKPLPGTYGSLSPDEADANYVDPGDVELLPVGADGSGNQEYEIVSSEDDSTPFNPQIFDLTTPDGHTYQVAVGQGLQKVTDLNGNVISIQADGIFETSAGSSSSTQILTYTRQNGLITAIKDPNGNSVIYTYGSGSSGALGTQGTLDLAQVQDRDGNNTTFYYDSAHDLLDVVAPNGGQGVRTIYDSNGRITKTIDAQNNITTYQYNVAGQNTETVTDPLNNQTVYTYDANGNVIEKDQWLNGTEVSTKSQFNDPNNPNLPTQEIDVLGRTTATSYDGNGNILSQTDPLGYTTSYSYNNFGEILSTIDASGQTSELNQYDSQGNRTSTTDAVGAQTTATYYSNGTRHTSTDALNHTTQYGYGGNVTVLGPQAGPIAADPGGTGLPTTITDANNHQTQYVYDSDGNQIHVVTTRTLNSGVVETIDTLNQYDGNGNLLNTTIYYEDGSGPVQSQVQLQNHYNDIGKIDYKLDYTGQKTSYSYDSSGRVVSTTTPDGVVKTTVYDQDGRVLDATVDATGVGGNKLITSYTYNSLGQQMSLTAPDGSVTYQNYDAAGQLTNSIDAVGNSIQYQYDNNGEEIADIDPMGHTTTYEYDQLGRKVSMTDANGSQTLYAYDNDDRLTKTTFPDNSFQTITYDQIGETIAETDQAGVTTGYAYDSLGRQTYVTNAFNTPDEAVTHYVYDEVGNRTRQYDANQYDSSGNPIASQVATVFNYDFLARPTGRTLPVGQSETTVYNLIPNPSGGGNVLQAVETDFNGHATTNEDDVMGRVASVTPDQTSSLSAAGKIPVTLKYDPTTGQRSEMDDASGKTTYSYDSVGHIIQKTHTLPNQTVLATLNYTYDLDGKLLNINDSANAGGVSLNYHWDTANRLVQVDDNNRNSTTYSYDSVGNLTNVVYPTATPVKTAYNYNNLNRLTSMNVATVGASPTTLATFGYTLGLTGNRTAAAEDIYASSTISRSVAYSYDNLYRLTKEQIVTDPVTTGTINYGDLGGGNNGYDRVGNRQSRMVNLNPVISGFSTVDSTFDANDRLTGSTYDANGNTTVETLPALPTLPVPVSPTSTSPDHYDFENCLIQRSDGTHTVTIVYDGDGNRVEKTVAGVTTYYVVDNQNLSGNAQVLEELTPSGSSLQLNRIYNYGLSLISQESGSSTVYYGYDGHGNVRFLLNSAGQITDTYTYDSFGELLARTGSTENNYLYCGEQYDPDLGLYYLRARYMSPGDGRFWTMDSYEGDDQDPLSLHKYLYAEDNPVNEDDPSGNYALNSILAPIADLLYAVPFGQGLNFISNLGIYAPPGTVDVYVWRGQFLEPLRSVGHVMVIEHNNTGVVYLSQFPFKVKAPTADYFREDIQNEGTFPFFKTGHFGLGFNGTIDFEDTTKNEEKRPPSNVFEVQVPDMVDFMLTAAGQHIVPLWGKSPDGVRTTQCSSAAYLALTAGGVDFHDKYKNGKGVFWPTRFDNDLRKLAKNPKSGVSDITKDAPK